ncbi:hypothetical protein KP509_11G089900 [Ceratopteris richardii]|uniref:VQ domain-containing protein n=1 Tax=Ceratopteris richardii TaxID=49495 RepID=A0A8T2TX20_CERRI|nr:hypothetical protein KP509_11G089900 [Ceratopteris richardii]
MTRSWELPNPDRRGPPRVYVPVSLPEHQAQAFAILELVGFSSSPAPPTSLRLPGEDPLVLPLSRSRFPAQKSGVSDPLSSQNSLLSLPLSSSAREPLINTSRQSSIRDLGPLTSAAEGEAFISLDKAKKPSSALSATSGTKVQIYRTPSKENVVHTTSVNFKDVVQKLTGAPSYNAEVTLPDKSADSGSLNCPSLSLSTRTNSPASKFRNSLSPRLDSVKAMKRTCKLLDRRKAAGLGLLNKLQAKKPVISYDSACSPALSPSPISTLTSFFDKFNSVGTLTSCHSSPSSSISSPSRRLTSQTEYGLTTPGIAVQCESSDSIHCQEAAEKHATASDATPVHGASLLKLFPESPM